MQKTGSGDVNCLLETAANGVLSSWRYYEGWNFNSGNYLFTTYTK